MARSIVLADSKLVIQISRVECLSLWNGSSKSESACRGVAIVLLHNSEVAAGPGRCQDVGALRSCFLLAQNWADD
jgi:hypothetical protein